MATQVPCSAQDAVDRANQIANRGGRYVDGSGDYRPTDDTDLPWTPIAHGVGSDCAGFALCWAYCLTRHRPGYNHGPWASVSDDINCNSALEDAAHARELFRFLTEDEQPAPGDLLCYPSFTIKDSDGAPHPYIGHVGIIIGTGRIKDWKSGWANYEQLDVAQCRGPDGRAPGVILTDGSVWSHHDSIWPKPAHRTQVLRAQPA